MAAPNQKTTTVHKEPTDKKHIYACINNEALSKAAINLSKGSAFKLWVYFAMNQNGYTFELSAVAVQQFCGITEKTYREAVKTLIAENYLVQRGDTNYYDFYELPKEREIKVPKDGSIIECHTTTFFE